MKKKISTLLLAGALASSIVLAQAPENAELSDGPQTLPTEDATPKTESIPATDNTAATEKLEDLKNDPEAPAETKASQEDEKKPSSNKVVSEEELIPPKKKDDKVKAAKVTESELYIQEADKYKLNTTFKNLALNDVIEQGLRKNYDQNIRKQQSELTDLQFKSIWNAFYLPEVKIGLTSGPQRISLLHRSSRDPSTPYPLTPTGALALSFGDYTVFNWGKDYALYLNNKESYDRTKQLYDESKRELKLDLISSYFNLMATKNIEKVYADQLRQASFVYRLNKEKITIGKTSKQDYYQARSEYLKAQNEFHEAKLSSNSADETMAYLIADEVGTKYVINENLDYRRIKITLDDTLNFAAKNNPTLLTDKASVRNTERSYDVALKENLPLPKFTMNLGAYNKRFGPATNRTVYETYSGSGNIELVATINATWSLTGADGFLNQNKLAIGRMDKEIALKELEKDQHYTNSYIRQTYDNILSYQNQLVILEARLPSLQKTFDTILDNYLNGKTKFYDVHIALAELTATKVLFEQTKYNHLKEKLNLAKSAGLEDFPGENFEHLATRIKGK